MKFEEMGLRSELLRAVDDLGYREPSPIQERAIPRALAGKDLMCCAQTGTGKTAAFSLPILQKLAESEPANVRALVLVPTRELAIQVNRNITDYAKHLDLVSVTLYGGVDIKPQEMLLRHRADIVVATPGRLIDHIWRGNLDFRHTEYLVLDEADRMLDMGFIKDVREIVELVPKARQSMLFSATLDSEIQRLSKDMLKNPERIEVSPPTSTTEAVDQYLVRVRGDRGSTLEELIRREDMTRTIIFARTKSGASRLAGRLRGRGHKATAIHSDRSQQERLRALEAFRAGKIHLLVATDIAARGIDVDDVSHVVNYDLPRSAEDYVHRIGRTARAGKRGMAVSLFGPEDRRSLEAIERRLKRKLPILGEDQAAPASSNGSNGNGAATSSGSRSNGSRNRRRTRNGSEGGSSRSRSEGAQRSRSRRRRSEGSREAEPVLVAANGSEVEVERESSRGRRRSRGGASGSRRTRSNGTASSNGRPAPAAVVSSAEKGESRKPRGFMRSLLDRFLS